MAYKLDYTYTDLDIGLINENINIKVYDYDFEVLCKNKRLRKQIVNFLEYLDIELSTLDEERLTEVIFEEFRLK